MNANAESSNPLQEKDLVDRVMQDADIASFIARNTSVEPRVRGAAEWLVKEYPRASPKEYLETIRRLLQSLLDQKLSVFFSYKAKDKYIAKKIARWLEEWSAGKLHIEHMARFGVEQVGRDWRLRIEEAIPRCDWFLLLFPSPTDEGDERDWVLFEAGYRLRGEALGGRFVVLHHPDNDVANVLGDYQYVPAEVHSVAAFLEGLFQRPNWVPGMPPLNDRLRKLELKAKKIVDLIQEPSLSVRSCCGPHMEVAFEDASAVRGWKQLARGRVVESNEDCKRLFGLQVAKPLFRDWVARVEGAGQDEGWVLELAKAVQAAGDGLQIPAIRATFVLGEGGRVRPTICAVRRRKSDQRALAVDIVFTEAENAHDTSTMPPGVAALAIMLQFSVGFRYQVLERYVGRKLEGKEIMAFNRAINELMRQVARDPRFAKDPSSIRERTLASFIGEDKDVVQKMFERWDQLYRPDGEGEMDRAINEGDGEALANLIKELLEINQRFLTVTSKRFAELVAGSGFSAKLRTPVDTGTSLTK